MMRLGFLPGGNRVSNLRHSTPSKDFAEYSIFGFGRGGKWARIVEKKFGYSPAPLKKPLAPRSPARRPNSRLRKRVPFECHFYARKWHFLRGFAREWETSRIALESRIHRHYRAIQTMQ